MSKISLSGIPTAPIRAQLSKLIESGEAPEDAATAVLAPYRPAPLAEAVWPFILQEARDIEGRTSRRVMKAAALSRGGTIGAPTSRAMADARLRLRETVYRLPDGTRVLWDDLTADELDVKIAWLRTQVGSILDHLNVLERARKLLADRGAARLGDVPGWADLIADASDEVDTPPSGTAR